MGKRTRHLKVDTDVWLGLRNLKKRYNKPMKDIAKTIFDTSDLGLLDEIYKHRRKQKS